MVQQCHAILPTWITLLSHVIYKYQPQCIKLVALVSNSERLRKTVAVRNECNEFDILLKCTCWSHYWLIVLLKLPHANH